MSAFHPTISFSTPTFDVTSQQTLLSIFVLTHSSYLSQTTQTVLVETNLPSLQIFTFYWKQMFIMSQFTRFFVWIKKRKQIFANMACGDKMTNIKERHVQKNFYFRALPKLPPPLTLRKYLVLSRVSPRSPVNIPLPSHPVFVTYSPYSPFPLHFLILLPFSQLVQACPVNIPPHPVFVTYSLSHILSHIVTYCHIFSL